jgi:hypothetical protein
MVVPLPPSMGLLSKVTEQVGGGMMVTCPVAQVAVPPLPETCVFQGW